MKNSKNKMKNKEPQQKTGDSTLILEVQSEKKTRQRSPHTSTLKKTPHSQERRSLDK
jgi:hypothetical protein